MTDSFFDSLGPSTPQVPSPIARGAGVTGEDQPFFDLGDTLTAIPRGVVEAGRNAYGLLDTLTGDSLPDWENNPLGKSKSTVGGVVEGIADFATGFIPAVGILGKIGKVGKVIEAGAEGIRAAEALGTATEALTTTQKVLGNPVARGLLAGAAADFTVWDGHQERLSNLIQSVPELANPINEYLASDTSDSQIEGRLKAAIEGAGVGAATELLMHGLKGLWAYGKTIREGGTEAAAEAAAHKVAPEKDLRRATRVAFGDPEDAMTFGSALDTGSNPARAAAVEYAQAKGITDPFPDPAAITVNEGTAKALADAYELAKHDPENPAVKASYAALTRDTLEQFKFVTEQKGLSVEPWTGKGEPYANSAAMTADIAQNNHLYFLPTEGNFSSKGGHPLQAASGVIIGGKDVPVNDLFRVVHDYFGHAAEGNQFGARGEEIAWNIHAHLFSKEALPALTAETRGQNSWVNFGKHLRDEAGNIPKKGEPGYIPPKDRPFAEQKATILTQPEPTLADKIKTAREQATNQAIDRSEALGQPVRPNARNRMKGLEDRLAAGKITPEQYAIEQAKVKGAMDAQVFRRGAEDTGERVRGAPMARERLAKAAREGNINESTRRFGAWFLDQFPQVADELTLSLSKTPGYLAGAEGDYEPIGAMVRFFARADITEAFNPLRSEAQRATTAVHEFLHHAERMLPVEVQDGIKNAWRRDLATAIANEKNPDIKGALGEMLKVGLGLYNSDQYAAASAKAFQDHGLKVADYYHFFGPSEYWAVKGSELLHSQYTAENSWIGTAREFIKKLWNGAKDVLGLKSDTALYKGIDALANVDGIPDGKLLTHIRSGSARFAQLAGDAAADPRSSLLREMHFNDSEVRDILEHATTTRPADFTDILGNPSPAVSPREMSPIEKLFLNLKDSDMSFKFWNTNTDAGHLLGTIDQLARMSGGAIPTQTLEQQSAQAFGQISDLTGLPKNALLAYLGRDLDNVTAIRQRAVAYAYMLESHTRYVGELAKGLKDVKVGDSAQALLKLREAMEFNADLQFGVKALRNEQGRALGSNRIKIGGAQMPEWLAQSSRDPRALDEEILRAGGEQHLKDLADKVLTASAGGENPLAVAKLARVHSAKNPRFDMLIEYWMNALLGGPKTMAVNILGPTINSVYNPLEKIVGAAALRTAAGGFDNSGVVLQQTQVMKDLVGSLSQLMHGAREGLGSVKAMGLSGEGLLRGGTGTVDPTVSRAAITAKNAGVDAGSAAGKAIDWLGKLVRVPTGILASSDEWVKQMNYRARALSHFTNEALEKGLSGDAAIAHVADSMEKMVWEHQAYSAESVWARAQKMAADEGAANVADRANELIQQNGMWDPKLGELSKKFQSYADEVTFTSKAPPGSLSQSLQLAVMRHPYLRFVIPFVNTPLNILRFTTDRINPANPVRALLSTQFPEYAKSLSESSNAVLRDFVSSDPEKKAAAIGKMTMGMGVSAFVMGKAFDGTITGRGPSDPEQRKTLQEAGWQPYSIRTANGYVSYARLDPFASTIGSIADIIDYGKFAPVEDQASISTLGAGILVSMANNFTNKSYLTGLSNFIEVLQEPDRKAERYMQRMVGSFVPNYFGQSVLPAGDDNTRDVRSILDAVSNRIPGLSSTLPPERNALGEPVKRVSGAGAEAIGRWVDLFQPIVYSDVSDDIVKQEMANLRHGFTPPKSTVGDMDLREVSLPSGQNAYDRWGELTGTVTVHGMNLKDALRRMIRSNEYQRLSDRSSDGFDSPRIGKINSVLQEYRAAARKQLLRESPELQQHEALYRTAKRQLSSGLDPRILPPQQN